MPQQGPWTKYQTPPAEQAGPWTKYAAPADPVSPAPVAVNPQQSLIDLAAARSAAATERKTADPLGQLRQFIEVQKEKQKETVKGLALEAATMGVGGIAGAVLPSAARAGKKFDQVLAAAKNVPLDTTSIARIAGETETLASRGGNLPKVIRDFIKAHTDDVPVTYEAGRDFAQNAADKAMSLTRVGKKNMARKVTQFTEAMKAGNREAATKVGMGELYDQAMKEYARAKGLEESARIVVKWGKRAALATLGIKGASELMGN